jgi:protein-disulfide isomerase
MNSEVSSELVVPVNERDHVMGPQSAPVTLVEYGDFGCPYCHNAVPIVEDLQRRLGDNLRFVYRHFPLNEIHPGAQEAAEASEAAAAQDKFWEMHASLFEHQPAFTIDDLVGYANELGLDIERFQSELRGHVHAAHVRDDFMGGIRSGVNGTPTFYIDGVRHDGPVSVRHFLDAIRKRHTELVIEDAEPDGTYRIPRIIQDRSRT